MCANICNHQILFWSSNIDTCMIVQKYVEIRKLLFFRHIASASSDNFCCCSLHFVHLSRRRLYSADLNHTHLQNETFTNGQCRLVMLQEVLLIFQMSRSDKCSIFSAWKYRESQQIITINESFIKWFRPELSFYASVISTLKAKKET